MKSPKTVSDSLDWLRAARGPRPEADQVMQNWHREMTEFFENPENQQQIQEHDEVHRLLMATLFGVQA